MYFFCLFFEFKIKYKNRKERKIYVEKGDGSSERLKIIEILNKLMPENFRLSVQPLKKEV